MPAAAANPDERWLRNARYARWLAWASLAWMAAEGAIGLIAGLAAGSIALVGWALGSGIEGLASVIVVWRFTGSRTLSQSAERQAPKAIAVSFWLLAPYIAVEAIRDLAAHHPASRIDLGLILPATTPATGRLEPAAKFNRCSLTASASRQPVALTTSSAADSPPPTHSPGSHSATRPLRTDRDRRAGARADIALGEPASLLAGP